MKKKAATKKVILKVEGNGQIKADPGSTPFTVLRKAGFNPKLWVIGDPEEKATTITYRVTEKGPEPEGTPEPPKMKTVYGDIEGSPSYCPKCKGYYPGEACPKCASEAVDGPEASSFPPGFQAIDPLTDTILSGEKAEGDTFEPVPVRLSLKETLAGLQIAVDITDGKGVLPILACIKIDAKETETILSATNLEASWTRALTSTGGPVARCIPARLLLAEIKALPAGTVDLELLFTTHAVSVNGRCDIITQDAEEFPELDHPSFEGSEVGNLLEAFKRVIPAVSSDQTRYALTGVFIDFENSKVVGTDGFRMHTEDITPGDRSMKPAIVPLRSAKIIAKHGSTNAIRWLDEKRLSLPLGGGVFATRVIEGTYPDWKGIHPVASNSVTFGREEFLKIVEGANAIVDDRRVLLMINHELVIRSEGGSGSYNWHIPCDSVLKTKKLSMVFNARFLTDAIKSYPLERVTLQAPDGYGACLINEKAIVMPIRV
jgi:DNA polymerase-3 subunit beta